AKPAGPTTTKESRRKFVVFSLDEQHYCVDILSVREIRMAQTITYIPGAPKYICGVINLRGSIVPVCDLRARFGRGETMLKSSQRIVITMTGGRATGLLVDEVLDIASILDVDISPIPHAQDGTDVFFKGLTSTSQEAMLILIDLEQVIGQPDATGTH
ncbi:MAG: chemotaxis protein CheW, partial [Hyphomicrobiaceae bacterium]|nr:chemotaxis protein CheW [Hyphomicrobiaceae bacterium]